MLRCRALGGRADPLSPTRGAPLIALRRWLGHAKGRRRRGPLPSLSTAHPGLPLGGRWIGLRAVPTGCIRGTASLAIPAARGTDFQPLPSREPADWRDRWARLEAGMDDQVVLPPVELVRAGGEYWVVDGHNRVALAKKRGQLWIDADVKELDIAEPEIAGPNRGPDKLATEAA